MWQKGLAQKSVEINRTIKILRFAIWPGDYNQYLIPIYSNHKNDLKLDGIILNFVFFML